MQSSGPSLSIEKLCVLLLFAFGCVFGSCSRGFDKTPFSWDFYGSDSDRSDKSDRKGVLYNEISDYIFCRDGSDGAESRDGYSEERLEILWRIKSRNTIQKICQARRKGFTRFLAIRVTNRTSSEEDYQDSQACNSNAQGNRMPGAVANCAIASLVNSADGIMQQVFPHFTFLDHVDVFPAIVHELNRQLFPRHLRSRTRLPQLVD